MNSDCLPSSRQDAVTGANDCLSIPHCNQSMKSYSSSPPKKTRKWDVRSERESQTIGVHVRSKCSFYTTERARKHWSLPAKMVVARFFLACLSHCGKERHRRSAPAAPSIFLPLGHPAIEKFSIQNPRVK